MLGELNEQRFREYDEATKQFEAALAIDPSSTLALEGLERICRVEERFGDLASVLERQVAIAEGDDARVEILVRLAELHEHHFVRPQQAATILEEAIRINPRHATAIGALERCYQATRAWPDLVRVIELRVRMADATGEKNGLLARIAEILELKMADAEWATRTWQRIWDQDPSSERALSELARLAERGNDWAAAAAYKAKLADLASTPEVSARIHVVIADMLSAPDRDPKLARVHYEKAASLHPNTTEAWEALEKEARDAPATRSARRSSWTSARRAPSRRGRRRSSSSSSRQTHVAQGDVRAAPSSRSSARSKADPTNEIAAEAMLATHVRERRWAEAQPLCDVLQRGTSAADAATRWSPPARRSRSLRGLATRIAFELGEKDRAFSAALAAYRAYPSIESAVRTSSRLATTCATIARP